MPSTSPSVHGTRVFSFYCTLGLTCMLVWHHEVLYKQLTCILGCCDFHNNWPKTGPTVLHHLLCQYTTWIVPALKPEKCWKPNCWCSLHSILEREYEQYTRNSYQWHTQIIIQAHLTKASGIFTTLHTNTCSVHWPGQPKPSRPAQQQPCQHHQLMRCDGDANPWPRLAHVVRGAWWHSQGHPRRLCWLQGGPIQRILGAGMVSAWDVLQCIPAIQSVKSKAVWQ